MASMADATRRGRTRRRRPPDAPAPGTAAPAPAASRCRALPAPATAASQHQRPSAAPKDRRCRASSDRGVPQHDGEQQIGQHAVVELHRGRVLEQVQLPGLHHAQAVGDRGGRPSAARCCSRGPPSGPRRSAPSHDLQEHEPDDQRRRRCDPGGRSRLALRRRCAAATAPSTSGRAKIRMASDRCSASRYWLTSMRSARPERTMYQPIAPCRPPSANSPAEPRQQTLATMRPRGQEEEERHAERRRRPGGRGSDASTPTRR